jgi:hypothetical protein
MAAYACFAAATASYSMEARKLSARGLVSGHDAAIENSKAKAHNRPERLARKLVT